MRQTRQSKFKQAFPHILGLYAVAALLTAATIYNRVPESRFSYDTPDGSLNQCRDSVAFHLDDPCAVRHPRVVAALATPHVRIRRLPGSFRADADRISAHGGSRGSPA